jgi:hypothetical protein
VPSGRVEITGADISSSFGTMEFTVLINTGGVAEPQVTLADNRTFPIVTDFYAKHVSFEDDLQVTLQGVSLHVRFATPIHKIVQQLFAVNVFQEDAKQFALMPQG